MAGTGRIYRRGDIYYIAYRWDGREYRESARSAERGVAEQLLAKRLRERRGSPPPAALTFDALAAWYLDDYIVRRLRTLDTARGRVANLRAVFGGWPATAITTEAIRDFSCRRASLVHTWRGGPTGAGGWSRASRAFGAERTELELTACSNCFTAASTTPNAASRPQDGVPFLIQRNSRARLARRSRIAASRSTR